jgi:hypothetical protein
MLDRKPSEPVKIVEDKKLSFISRRFSIGSYPDISPTQEEVAVVKKASVVKKAPVVKKPMTFVRSKGESRT